MTPWNTSKLAFLRHWAAQAGSQPGQVSSQHVPTATAATSLIPSPTSMDWDPQGLLHSLHCMLSPSHLHRRCLGRDFVQGILWDSGRTPTHGHGLLPRPGWGATDSISGFLPGRCSSREDGNTLTWSPRSLRSCLWNRSHTPMPRGWLCWERGGEGCPVPLHFPIPPPCDRYPPHPHPWRDQAPTPLSGRLLGAGDCGMQGHRGMRGHGGMRRPSSSRVTLETAPESHIPVTTEGLSHCGGEAKPHSPAQGDSRGAGKRVPQSCSMAGTRQGESCCKGGCVLPRGPGGISQPRAGREAPARVAVGQLSSWQLDPSPAAGSLPGGRILPWQPDPSCRTGTPRKDGALNK